MSAAIPSSVVQKTGRSSSNEAKGPMSHGRGGAGNMGTAATDFDRPSLDTPTIKSDVYTTGRGGSGNMAKNDDPEAARRAQDVVGHPRRESNNSTHVGRGGAANVFSPAAIAELKKNNGHHESAIDAVSQDGEKQEATAKLRSDEKGWADRSKAWLLNPDVESSSSTTDIGSKGVEAVKEHVVIIDTGDTVTFQYTPGDDPENVYPGTRRIPRSSTKANLNKNRVCGGVFEYVPEYGIYQIANHEEITITDTTQAVSARKGLYSSRFKSSFNLRERFSHVNLSAKAKEDEEKDDGDDVGGEVPKKNKNKSKLGMRLAFGKSTFF